MYYNDAIRGKNGAEIYRTKTGFRYPLSKERSGQYKVKSGEMLRVCMNSDFFLEEADPWRDEAWEIIHQRPDVKFFLLTKRPERVAACLPYDWGDGWENVMFNVTCENQLRADERIPILLELPFKHKGIMCAPFIGPVSIKNTCLKVRSSRYYATERPMTVLVPVIMSGSRHCTMSAGNTISLSFFAPWAAAL